MRCLRLWCLCFLLALPATGLAASRDLPGIKAEGVLRHLGVPYANFIAGDGTGLDVDFIKMFAAAIGVRYEFVETNWKNVIPDLLGRTFKVNGQQVELLGEAPQRGDVIANGLTVLPWRQKILHFTAPTFPTQVWLITGAHSPLRPIAPSGDIQKDIQLTKTLLPGKTVLGMEGTCLDLSFYDLHKVQAVGSNFTGNLNELALAVLNGKSDTTLLDVPDAPLLQQAFAEFFQKIQQDGSYTTMVMKYYPDVIDYYPDFFGPEKK